MDSDGRNSTWSAVIAIAAIIGMLAIFNYYTTGWANFFNQPNHFFVVFVSALILILSACIVSLWIRKEYQMQWKYDLRDWKAKMKWRWNHFIKRRRRTTNARSLPF